MALNTLSRPSISEIAAWLVTAGALLLILLLHLLPALLAGLLVFELVHVISPIVGRRLSNQRAKLIAVALLSFVVISLLILAAVGMVAFFRSDAGNLPGLFAKMAQIIEDSRKVLPPFIIDHLPPDAETFKQTAALWLRTHAAQLQLAGTEAGRLMAHILVGMIIGAMVALREVVELSSFPVIASGGISRIEDVRAVQALGPRVEGAIVGKALYDGKLDYRAALASLGEGREAKGERP